MKTTDKEYQIKKLEDRVNRLEGTEKNIKCGGALRKARRKLRALNK